MLSLLVGLWQIKMLKRDIRIRNQRLSVEKAVEAGSRYLTRYVELSSIFTRDSIEKGLSFHQKEVGNFLADSLSDKSKTLERMNLSGVLEKLNELEIISSYFTSGVADEAAGFNIIGRTFCTNVEFDYDLISVFRRGKPHDPWSNIVKLYGIWRPRLDSAEVNESILRMRARIKAMQSKQTAAITEVIRPIGV